MNTNELMIGDWVKLNNRLEMKTEFVKVSEIHNSSIYWSIPGDIISTDADEWDLEPILITEEILNVNGFVKHNSQLFYGTTPIDDVVYSIDGDVKILGCNFPIAIVYVHKLQHALRLCGLNKLADNFKIV